MPNNLPLNWCECKLGDVFHTSSGGTPSRRETAYYGGDIPWLKSGELNDGIISEAEEFITKEGLENSSAKIFPKGSILLALYGATVGKIGKLDFDSATNQAICCMYPCEFFNMNLLFYYLLSQRKFLINQGKGGAQPNISQDIVKNLMLPLPPLAEQERIVEKIEALFAGIDEGVERLKSAQAQIKQYRQSVLKSAFEGKLYKTTDWKETTLGKSILPKRKRVLPNRDNQENPFIGMDCIEPNSLALSKVYKYKEMKSSAFSFEKGDVLYGRMRSYLNKVYLAEFSGIASAEFIIFSSNSNLSSEYLKYLLHQQDFVKYATRNASGDRPRVKFETDLAMYKFLLPKLPEQQRIVEEIEKRFAVADVLEKAVNEGLEKADKLKQSILKKAFEGKLAPQNPNDEPASVLLERIKKSQTPTKGKKK